jgi:hypothetical protein
MNVAKREDLKRIGVAIAVAAVVAALFYFGGRWQERGRAAAEQRAMAAQVAEVRTDQDRLRVELATAEERARLFQVRALLFETALDLERRNFGTAQQRLKAAAARLEATVDAGPTIPLDEIRALHADVTATDLTVAADVATQRNRVLGFVARLDEILDRIPGSSSGP